MDVGVVAYSVEMVGIVYLVDSAIETMARDFRATTSEQEASNHDVPPNRLQEEVANPDEVVNRVDYASIMLAHKNMVGHEVSEISIKVENSVQNLVVYLVHAMLPGVAVD